ncbi:MAG: class I SAM-dependent methyltransferase [Bacteroidia bacterium]|nr:class I SAM-dependent methyltransferase [Bacteroidia bacterium]MCC7532409.1 class I SAM-dependent methyltransferase [Bacteroidia bacterium]
MKKTIIDKVNKYYTEKIKLNGDNSLGVDWNSHETHVLRFFQLSKLIEFKQDFSILDYGCGYGALVDYLNENDYNNYEFYGYDISNEMIKRGKEKYKKKNIVFGTDINTFNKNKFDYVIANGIFNVKLDTEINKWKEYVLQTITEFDKISNKGFAFNILTSYSEEPFMKDYLYYADPLFIFDFCKKNFSKRVALLHDYPLYEFSIIVRK